MGHWYEQETGKACHFQPNGANTTLTHARKQGLWRSVTSILNLQAKPALTNWLQETVLIKSQEMPLVIGDETDDEWARRVIAAAREDTKAKADEGSAVHDALELYYKDQYEDIGEFWPICEAVDEALTEYCGEQDWVPEQTLASPEGYGGMCDLHCHDFVVDFKTKDGDVSKARGYGEQGMQLAAYRRALLGPESDARLLNVFVSRQFDQFPAVTIYEHTDPLLWAKFERLLGLQHLNDRHGPIYDALIGQKHG